MANVVIPYSNGRRLVLTEQETEELIANAQAALREHRARAEDLSPIEKHDGYITRDDVYTFFSQVYPQRDMLRIHAGRLFGAIVHASLGDKHATTPFKVLCGLCGASVTENYPQAGRRHYYRNYDPYLVEVESLRTNVEHFMSQDVELATRSIKDDLTLLLRYL